MKLCRDCQELKPLDAFYKCEANKDGKTTYCKVCQKARVKASYDADPASHIRRVYAVKAKRFAESPGLRRAVRLWNHVYMRSANLACMSITDFVPICREADKKGPDYVLDHIIPLRHPEVCGLHVPWNLRVVKRETNLKKGNGFVTCWNRT